MEDKIVVTIGRPVQMGMDVWKDVYTSRVFSKSRSIEDMLKWAELQGIKDAKMADLQFSAYTGSSI